jgi:hypothetical protein
LKRQRYEVKWLNRDGEACDDHVLAYTLESAEQIIKNLGGTVEQIAKVGRAKDSGVRVDQEALAQAVELLGLKLPVRIGYKGGRPGVGSHGSHIVTRGAAAHKIVLATGQDAESMSRALWHELTHASQYEWIIEQVGGDMDRAFRIWGRTRHGRYEDRTIEREARAGEARHEELALAR